MHICIFEDEFYKKLQPLVYFRPVHDLRCGITSLREKIVRCFPDAVLALHTRNYLAEALKEEFPTLSVNRIHPEAKKVLFINGRLLISSGDAMYFGEKYPGTDIVYQSGADIVAAWVSGRNLDRLNSLMKESALDSRSFQSIEKKDYSGVRLVRYPWDLVRNNGFQLGEDFKNLTQEGPRLLGNVHQGAHLVNPSQIHVGEGTVIKPGVVIDAEKGPVYISNNVTIMSNAVIEGPAFIGENSTIKIGAKIYENTTIGESCKVGGEVEESIIHAFSNKQHEGFVGHSYLGEWVNIGADSNTSDLKNDYGNVKVYNDGEFIDSGNKFVGLTMGDHSKCGINSMFNTGTVVSVCCNIYGSGLPPKYVPAFSWGEASGKYSAYRIEKAVEVARTVMARRNLILSGAGEELFRKVFEMTREERAVFGVGEEARS